MQLLEELKHQINRVWEPVLCPLKTPINNDLLGGEFVSVDQNRMFRRHDQRIKSFDNHYLEFSTYLKINNRLSSIINLKTSSDFFGSDSINKVENEFKVDSIKSIFLNLLICK